jgi:DNA-binding NarL/FixJ family response regulator
MSALRIILIGPAEARARLRTQLPDPIDVVGEALSVAGSQGLQREVAADALMIATAGPPSLEDDEPADEPLTARELEVLALLAQGLPNKRIAQRLGISDQTVKFHVAAITGKLNALNRTDAVRRGLRRGLIAL